MGTSPEHFPTSHGFDSYYGVPFSTDMGVSAWDSSGDGAQPLPLIRSVKDQPGSYEIIEQPTDLNLLSDRYIEEAVSFITDDTDQEPFLLYLPFNHVHVPNHASEKFCNSTTRGVYGDALAELDDAVGQILKSLDESNQRESTMVFFTSDNGPWLFEKLAGGSAGLLRDGKSTTWEGGVRVPGIISMGEKIKPRVERNVVATYDIFTTIAAIAGAPLEEDRVYDGVDLSTLLFSDKEECEFETPHECIFHYKGQPWETDCGYDEGCPGLWAARCGSLKAHFVTNNSTFDGTGAFKDAVFHDPPIMFNVDRDPGENFILNSTTTEYINGLEIIRKAIKQHEEGMTPVPNQARMGSDPSLVPCCNDDAGGCMCNEENMNVFVCNGDVEESVIRYDRSNKGRNPNSCVSDE